MEDLQYLPASLSTLYMELLQQVQSAEAQRDITNLVGTFVAKNVKGKCYWYLQFVEAGKQKQIYLGPENEGLLKIMSDRKTNKIEKMQDQKNRQMLCQMLVNSGAAHPESLSASVIGLLSDSGIFKMGAILVGTHAFLAYANMLGVKWPATMKTQDIDVAQDRYVSVALYQDSVVTNLPDTLEHAQMGFHPIPELNPKHPSTSFKIRGKEIHLDILTPLVGRPINKPLFLPSLQVAAQPLRYLDYLIEHTLPAVLLHKDGILVHVPTPARFSFHKLIVSQERSAAFHAKLKKDLEQARLLFTVLLDERPGDIHEAWNALKTYGKKWVQLVQKALKVLKKHDEDLVNQLQKFLN